MSSLPITLGTLLLLFSVYSTSVEGNCRPGPPGPRVAGATYVRWGRTSCPTELGTQLLYAGRAAGPHHYHQGGGANLLCLPDVPDYLYTLCTLFKTMLHCMGSSTTLGLSNQAYITTTFLVLFVIHPLELPR